MAIKVGGSTGGDEGAGFGVQVQAELDQYLVGACAMPRSRVMIA